MANSELKADPKPDAPFNRRLDLGISWWLSKGKAPTWEAIGE
jgi:hypothetical protein